MLDQAAAAEQVKAAKAAKDGGRWRLLKMPLCVWYRVDGVARAKCERRGAHHGATESSN